MKEKTHKAIIRLNSSRGNTLDMEFPKVIQEGVYMNIGVSFMPFMKEGYYFLKEDRSTKSSRAVGVNNIAKDFVKYLYTIRKANKERQMLPYTIFSGPRRLQIKDRVFVAGKIFPVLSISYSGEDIDCDTSKVKIKSVSLDELRLLFGETFGEYQQFSVNYLSIDSDAIRIYLPKNTELGIDYAGLLKDFLTNGEQTSDAVMHGEFPDLELYTLATGHTALQPGCWLTGDRERKNAVWKNACMYILEYQLQGVIGPFEQIADFYTMLDDKITKETQHKTRWLKGAKNLVQNLSNWMEINKMNYFVANDVETILYELNIGICDYAVTQFYELFYGKYKETPLNTLTKAYEFDLSFVQHEQGVVAVPIYSKTSKKTIEKYQSMADQDGVKEFLSGVVTGVIPEFDEPWQGKVTDAQFRIDLPMLMLWLDRHQPYSVSGPFKGKVNSDGYLLEEFKEIIRKYEAK